MYKAIYAHLNNGNDNNHVKYVTKSTYMRINTYNFKQITGIILNKAKHIAGTLRSDMLKVDEGQYNRVGAPGWLVGRLFFG